MDINSPARTAWPSQPEYVQQRNGVPLGASGSLRNMLTRSLGAGSFGEFWQCWNPIWGYGLKRFIHADINKL